MKALSLCILIVGLLSGCVDAFSQPTKPTKVAIAGAGSSVGLIVFKKLLKKKNFQPVGIVRDHKGYKTLKKLGVSDDQIRVCDITIKDSLAQVFDSCQKLVICTTATPKKRWIYRLKNAFRWLVGRTRAPRPSELYYEKHKRPYEIDYLGQKNLIDSAVKANVEHIVLLGSMGGYRGSRLNEIGRKTADDPDIHNGNILKWKRAAERYLMKRCFFTILHAAQLTDDPPSKEVVWDTDDMLLRSNFKKIPREDVAEVIVQALQWTEAINRSIDIAAGPVNGRVKDWLRFWARPGDCTYPADDFYPTKQQ